MKINFNPDVLYAANENMPLGLGNLSPLPTYQGHMQQGEVYGLNDDSRFVQANFSQPLTTYALGWKDDQMALDETLEFVAPAVTVARRFEYIAWNNAQEFQALPYIERPIGSEFNRVEMTSSKNTDKVNNIGLCVRLDPSNYTDVPNWEEMHVGWLMRLITRSQLYTAINLLDAAAIAASAQALNWSHEMPKSPDIDLWNAILACGDISGINPNRQLWGMGAWSARLMSLSQQFTAGSMTGAFLKSPDELAQFLQLSGGIHISKERYQDSATTKARMVGSAIYTYFANSGATTLDPSNIKRFVAPCEGGQMTRVYRQETGPHSVEITVERYSKTVITYAYGINKLSVS